MPLVDRKHARLRDAHLTLESRERRARLPLGPALQWARSPTVLLVAGALLALAAAIAAPSSALLPGPDTPVETLVSALALTAAFALGLALPLQSVYVLLALVVIEGAIRKWIVNDITVFLLKDFLVLGVYAAIVPRLTGRQLRRPWWLLAPLVGIVALALASSLLSESPSQAVIGLRSYLVYLPLLWVGSTALGARRRSFGLLLLLLALGVLEATFAGVQALAGPGVLNKLVSGALPALVKINGTYYLRPSGTFMQVGVLAAFLVFPALAAFSLIWSRRRGWLLALGLATPVFLAWGVVYTGSRVLLASVLLAGLALAAALAVGRRFLSLAGLAAALAVGIGLTSVVSFGGRSVKTFVALDDGTPVRVDVKAPARDPGIAGGYLSRAAGFSAGRGEGLGSRLEPQLELISHQRLVGHGTGTMTLGSEYALPRSQLAGEGNYSKIAWELGLVGLALFVWFVGAVLVAAARSVRSVHDWRRTVALVGLGAAALVPLWMTTTFAIDYPTIAILYYLFAGYAVAPGAGSSGSSS